MNKNGQIELVNPWTSNTSMKPIIRKSKKQKLKQSKAKQNVPFHFINTWI